jgi:hypothetical protein
MTTDIETEPMPFGDRRQHRRLLRFDPTVSSGTLMQLVALVVGFGSAYATYQSDRATQRLEIEQIKASVAAEKAAAKESIVDLRLDVRKVQETITSVDKTLTGIQAQLEFKKGNKP